MKSMHFNMELTLDLIAFKNQELETLVLSLETPSLIESDNEMLDGLTLTLLNSGCHLRN